MQALSPIEFPMECKIPGHPHLTINGYVTPNLHKSESLSDPMGETILREIRHWLHFLIGSKSRQEFLEARENVFPEFFKLVVAYSLVRSRNDNDDEGFTEIECYFVNKRSTVISDKEQCKRILFNIGTLRRSYNLITRIVSAALREEDLEKDKKLASRYSQVTSWVNMHIACLILAIRKDSQDLHPDVLQELLDGSDLATETYSIAREAIELREGILLNTPHHDPVVWDEEDDAWANAS